MAALPYRLVKKVKSEKSGAWPLVNRYRFPMSRTFPSDATRTEFISRTVSAGSANTLAAAAYFAVSHSLRCPGSSLIIVLILMLWRSGYILCNRFGIFRSYAGFLRESEGFTWLDECTLSVPGFNRRCGFWIGGLERAGSGRGVGRCGILIWQECIFQCYNVLSLIIISNFHYHFHNDLTKYLNHYTTFQLED